MDTTEILIPAALRNPSESARGRRIAVLSYSVAVYGLALSAILYFIGFVGGFWATPTAFSSSSYRISAALTVDLALISSLIGFHGLMSWPAFKRQWEKTIPQSIERSTRSLMWSLLLGALAFLWQPLPGTVWQVTNLAGQDVLWTIFWAGWFLALASIAALDHTELLGLRQGWAFFSGRRYFKRGLVVRGPYRHLRNPILLGLSLASWSTPTMTSSRCLLAGAVTIWALFSVRLEEKSLALELGESYRRYMRRVPRFLPSPGRARSG